MLRRLIALLVALVFWHVAAQLSSSVIFPSPLACFEAGREAIEDGSLWRNSKASLIRVSVGYLLVALSGLILGALSGISGRWGAGFRDLLELLRPIPPIA